LSKSLAAAMAVSVLLGWAGTARAYRPFDGTHADVAEEGNYEVEIGPAYLREGDGRFLIAPWIINNVGIARGHELVLEAKYFRTLSDPSPASRSRLLGTGLFWKALLRRGSEQEGTGPSVATELGPLLPQLGDKGGFGASFTALVTQRWRAFGVHLNLGNALDREQRYVFFLGTIFEGPKAWTVRPVAEVFLERTFQSPKFGDGLTRSALVGLMYPCRDDLTLDAGARIARNGSTDSYEVRAGLTWAIRMWGGP
jgi:hypothetical protein